MHLVRRLTLVACRQHFSFSARHIPGHRNAAADALSRLHFQEFPGPDLPIVGLQAI